MSNDCIELENIKYQTMLLNSNSNIVSVTTDTKNIDEILNQEMESNKKMQWNKLNKSNKLVLLKSFSSDHCKDKNYNKEIEDILIDFLTVSLERKRITKIKDIIYDTKSGVIKDIPNLSFDPIKNKFTLRCNKKNITQKKTNITQKKRT
jgi:hypothetical protein